MAKKKKPTLGKAILNLLIGIPSLLSLTGRIGSLIRFEARLASKSIVGIMILALVCALLLTSCWLCVLAMLFIYLMSLQWSMQIILLILFSINIIMLIIICGMMKKYKKRLFFPKTCHLIEEARSIYEEL